MLNISNRSDGATYSHLFQHHEQPVNRSYEEIQYFKIESIDIAVKFLEPTERHCKISH